MSGGLASCRSDAYASIPTDASPSRPRIPTDASSPSRLPTLPTPLAGFDGMEMEREVQARTGWLGRLAGRANPRYQMLRSDPTEATDVRARGVEEGMRGGGAMLTSERRGLALGWHVLWIIGLLLAIGLVVGSVDLLPPLYFGVRLTDDYHGDWNG